MMNVLSTNDIFVPGAHPILLYSAKQEYGHQRHDRPLHKHDSLCELLLCYRGFGTYNVGALSYSLQQGDIVFGNMGELHELISDYDTEIGTYCFGIGNLQFRDLPPNFLIPSDTSHVRASGNLFPFLSQLAEQIDRLSAGDGQDQLTAQLMLASLVLLCIRLPNESYRRQGAGQDNQLVGRIRSYIDAHYTERITLESIAQEMHCSVPYVSHAFKTATGYSPIQYVIRRRIGLAQTWLISSDFSATRIATMVGYDDANYFCTLFNRVVGMSPLRYRQHYLESLRGERNQS